MKACRHLIVLFYVNIFFIISMPGCQTIQQNEEKVKKETEILNTQKSLIVSFLNQGLPHIAHKELRLLILKYPKDPDFKNLIGLTYLALENPQKAASFFQQSLKLKYRAAVALNLSSAYIEAKDFNRAIRLLLSVQKSEVAKSYPYPERIAHNIALAAERKNDVQAAEKFYLKALAENPQYYLSLMRLGQLYERSDRHQLAVKTFSTARAVCNQCFDPVNGMVMNYLATKSTNLAMETIRIFLRQKDLNPSDRDRANKLLKMTEQIAANVEPTAPAVETTNNKTHSTQPATISKESEIRAFKKTL